MKDELNEIIEQLMLLPEIIISNPQEVAFSLGFITAQLEYINLKLKNWNGEF